MADVVFLLTDIVGSTTLWEQQPEAMSSALRTHDWIVARALHDLGGDLVKAHAGGDSALAVFASPSTAAAAAIAIQQRLGEQRWPTSVDLEVRIGIDLGPAERRGGDYFGPTLNRVARVCAAAPPGGAFVTGDVATRLHPSLVLAPLGAVALDGIAAPVDLHALVGAR